MGAKWCIYAEIAAGWPSSPTAGYLFERSCSASVRGVGFQRNAIDSPRTNVTKLLCPQTTCSSSLRIDA